MLEKYPSLGICVLVQFLPLSYSQGVCTWWLLHCTKRTDRKDLRRRCHISVALKYCDKWWLSVQCNFCVFWQHTIAMKHTTFIMQVLPIHESLHKIIILICNVVFQLVNVRTQILLQCIQCIDYALLENTLRILLQSGYSKWHHSGRGMSTRTRMGQKIG